MTNIFLNFILLINEYCLLIISIILSFLIFTFILDRFRLSDNKYIRFLQKLLFIILGIILILFIYECFLGTPVECESNEGENLNLPNKDKKDNEIKVNGSIIVYKEGGLAIAKSINNSIGQIRIGITIGGVAAAVSSVIKTTSLTPLQKVGLTLAGGVIGGLTHVESTAVNRALASEIANNKSTDNSGRVSPSEEFSPASPLDKELYFGNNNSVEILLYSIYGLNIINFILILFLIFNLITKLLLNKNLELKWLDKLIPQPYNSKFKSFIIKTLKYTSKSNTINITLIIIILLISNIGSIYFLTILINNFETFCKVYLKSIIK